MRCYKGEIIVDAMVQTRGQQTRDQSSSSRFALWGVTAEGDAASTAATSGNTLKHAVSVLGTEHSAAVLAGGGSGWHEPVSPLGAGSPTTISVSAPMGKSMLLSGAVSKAGNGVQMTDSQWVTQGCSVIDEAIGGSANAGHHVLYSVPPPRNPISQPIIYGDLSSGPVTTNFGSQCGVPNLFGLPAPVHTGTVPAGASNTILMAAACARSTPAARVDKSGTDTALRDRRLANYEARLKQEGPVSLVPTAVVSASAPRNAEHGQMVHAGADGVSNSLQVGEAVSPWTHHQERAHRSARLGQPSAGGQYIGEGIPCITARSVPHYDETSDDDNYQPGFHPHPYLGTHEPDLAHPDVIRGYQEWPSRRDWYRATNRPVPTPLPRHREFGIPQPTAVDRGPVRPYPQVRLAQMQDFQGDGSVTLDMFSDQVYELSQFYHWDGQETCRHTRAHLRGTALAYVRRAPFHHARGKNLKLFS